MKVWGLTGGIGMGKTTTAQRLLEFGVTVIDTDVLARQVVEPGQPALAEINSVFGPGVVATDGRLKRDELAKLVFADSVARGKLEQILHPRIRSLWLERVEDLRSAGENLVVVIIPLLFETQADSHFEKILCATCLPVSQHERLTGRGWSSSHIAQRLAAQWSIAEKIAKSDYVLWTEGTLESLFPSVGTDIARKMLVLLTRGFLEENFPLRRLCARLQHHVTQARRIAQSCGSAAFFAAHVARNARAGRWVGIGGSLPDS